MTLRLKFIFFIAVSFLVLWFLYIERQILTPFIFAAIFAYIFNPIVTLLNEKVRLPRTFSVIVIYALIISIIVGGGVLFSKRAVDESAQLRSQVYSITQTAKSQINALPDWLKPTLNDTLATVEKSNDISYPSVYSFFPEAFSRIIGFLIFLFATFYFLKEGGNMFDKLLNFIPSRYKIEADILFKKINSILGSYLRGQLFLVIIVSIVLFICLTILGVRYSLILAIFSGFAEIVPIIGPIFATTVAAIVAYMGGNSNFGLEQYQLVAAVIIVYFVVRQIQDYLINPYIMGKITKLHPLIILFAVLAGEHTAGILGLIIAVPLAGVIKIIFEYCIDYINDKEIEEKYK